MSNMAYSRALHSMSSAVEAYGDGMGGKGVGLASYAWRFLPCTLALLMYTVAPLTVKVKVKVASLAFGVFSAR